MIFVKVAISPDCSAACSTPVRTVTSEPSSAWSRRVSSSGTTPSSAATCTASSWPSLSSSRCAVGRSRIAKVALPSVLRSPYLATPTISNSSAEPSAATPMRSPTCRSSSLAVLSSTTTSPSPPAHRPSTRSSGLKRSASPSVSSPKANAGEPPVPIASPSGLTQLRLEILHRAGREPDAVHLAHAVERLRRDRRRLGLLALEADPGLLAGDDGVGARVGLDEDRVERLVDRVREHVGAAHHGDAEHDRDRREDGAELPPGEAAEGDFDHGATFT